jgi:urease accessory protein
MTSKSKIFGLATLFMVTAVSGAQAHVGADSVHGIASGFVHPIGGLDHVLAMIAVGVLAAQQGGKALWLIPLSFVSMMIVGGVLGFTGIDVPFVEQGISGSIIILGFVVALGRTMPLGIAIAMVGMLSIFHGHAHGTEMPVDASGFLYGIGFAIATTVLHVCGIGAAASLQKLMRHSAPVLVRLGGGAVAAAGMAMLAGA